MLILLDSAFLNCVARGRWTVLREYKNAKNDEKESDDENNPNRHVHLFELKRKSLMQMGQSTSKGCKHIYVKGKKKGERCNRTPVNTDGYCSSCRVKIPKRVREEVWEKYNGKNYIGKCACCLKDIEVTSFHCGHIQPASQGGLVTLDNLLPLCSGCNLSMNDMPFYQYLKLHYPKHPLLKK